MLGTARFGAQEAMALNGNLLKNKKEQHTRIVAFAGTALIAAPILFTLLTAVVGSIASRSLRMDYLIPAELFPMELAGALLLLWAARRSGFGKRPIGLSLAIMVSSLIACQGAAVITGLASGETETSGWPFWLLYC
jgi:peptidoglycan/LPS O-acetylase OafA/YrhL